MSALSQMSCNYVVKATQSILGGCFSLVVLRIISQLLHYSKHWSIAKELWVKLWTSHKMTSVLVFMRTCVPKMINYIIISLHLQLSNGKATMPAAINKPFYQWLSIRLSSCPLGCHNNRVFWDQSSLMERVVPLTKPMWWRIFTNAKRNILGGGGLLMWY